MDFLTFHGHSYQKVLFIFYLFLSVSYKDQNPECPLGKYEKFSIVLEKFAVNVEVSKKEGIAYKAQGNLNLVLSRYLTYKKVSRIKFTRLKNHL